MSGRDDGCAPQVKGLNIVPLSRASVIDICSFGILAPPRPLQVSRHLYCIDLIWVQDRLGGPIESLASSDKVLNIMNIFPPSKL
jgi:hypothetical protein